MKRLAWGLVTVLGTMFLPFHAISGYLAFAGNGSQRNGFVDILAIVVAALTGFACLLLAPVEKPSKFACGAIYLPAMGFMVFAYIFQFVCAYYRECM